MLDELRRVVDPALIDAARRARAERIAVENAIDAAERDAEENNLPDKAPRTQAFNRAQARRTQAVQDAHAALPVARAAEQGALSALGGAVMPHYNAARDEAVQRYETAQREARAVVEAAHRALKAFDRLDPVEALLKEHEYGATNETAPAHPDDAARHGWPLIRR